MVASLWGEVGSWPLLSKPRPRPPLTSPRAPSLLFAGLSGPLLLLSSRQLLFNTEKINGNHHGSVHPAAAGGSPDQAYTFVVDLWQSPSCMELNYPRGCREGRLSPRILEVPSRAGGENFSWGESNNIFFSAQSSSLPPPCPPWPNQLAKIQV